MTILLGKKYSQIYKDSSYIPLILKRQYLNFNGLSYGEVPAVILENGDTVGFNFVATDSGLSNFTFMLAGTGATDGMELRFATNRTIRIPTDCSVWLDGDLAVQGVTMLPDDGLSHAILVRYDGLSQIELGTVGCAYTGSSTFCFNGFIYDLVVSQPSNAGSYPNPPSWPIANGFTLGATTPNINDPSGSTDMDLFNVLEGDWTTELPS